MCLRTALMFAAMTFAAAAPAAAANVASDAPPVTDSASPIAGLYGNVVSVHNEQTNSDSTFAFQPDRTFIISVTRRGRPVRISGLWGANIDGTEICFQPSPLGGVTVPEMQSCLPLAQHVLGDRWTTSNSNNQTVDISVSATQ